MNAFGTSSSAEFVSAEQLNDNDGGLRISGFLPQAHPLRRSVADFYGADSHGYHNAYSHGSHCPTTTSSPPSDPADNRLLW